MQRYGDLGYRQGDLNKSDLLLRTVGTQERLTATVAVEGGGSVPITWVSSNPGVVTVDADGVVTAVADGEAKVTALFARRTL